MMQPIHVLVAEDEQDIRDLLTIHLEREGYRVLAARDGEEAWELIRRERIDLAILDVMMPRMDGFNLLRRIRESMTFPVIFLTARTEDMDKILGLGLGADDYLAKPFNVQELLARVKAQLRRQTQYGTHLGPVEETLRIGDLTLDPVGCTVSRAGEELSLNAKEYKLLKYFMENPGRVFTKQQLYRAVWEEELFTDDNTVMVHISHLRNKIEPDPKRPVYILTIRGIGYKMVRRDGEAS